MQKIRKDKIINDTAKDKIENTKSLVKRQLQWPEYFRRIQTERMPKKCNDKIRRHKKATNK